MRCLLILLLVVSEAASQEQTAEPESWNRDHSVRVGGSIGTFIPFDFDEYNAFNRAPGLSYQICADVPLDSRNIHLVAGYEHYTVPLTVEGSYFEFTYGPHRPPDRTEYIETVSLAINYGVLGIQSAFSPYVHLGLALVFSHSSGMLLTMGGGVDYYVTANLILFGEVLPSIQLRYFEYVWMPMRLGVKTAF